MRTPVPMSMVHSVAEGLTNQRLFGRMLAVARDRLAASGGFGSYCDVTPLDAEQVSMEENAILSVLLATWCDGLYRAQERGPCAVELGHDFLPVSPAAKAVMGKALSEALSPYQFPRDVALEILESVCMELLGDQEMFHLPLGLAVAKTAAGYVVTAKDS